MEPLTLPTSDLLAPHGRGPETEPFWEGTAKGELRAQRCGGCQRLRFPPLPSCPHCGSLDVEWVPTEGTPTLYSWVVVERSTHRDIPAPFCVALAEFAEGVRVPGNLLYDREHETPRAGTRLEVDFAPVGDVHVPVYRMRERADG